jgi:hypothetical protein
LAQGTFNWQAWFQKHTPAQTSPPLDKVIKALEEQGVVAIGATGYCFGGACTAHRCSQNNNLDHELLPGRYVFHLAFDNKIKVAVVSHPTLLEIPGDLEVISTSTSQRDTFTHSPCDNRNTTRPQKLHCSSTAALSIRGSRLRLLRRRTAFSAVASSPLGTNGSTLRVVRTDLRLEAI